MRKLNEYSEKSDAQLLSDFLDAHGIENNLREQSQGFGVWVVRDEELARAKELLEEFSPENARELRREAEAKRKERERHNRPVLAPRTLQRDPTPGVWGAGVLLLVAGCVVVALLSQLGSSPLPALYIAPVNRFGFFVDLDWTQPWRFVTPMFLHFGIFHVVFNMMWLRQLGGQIEQHDGTIRFLLFVVVASALSNLAQYWLKGPLFGGMSGVNYALFAYVWMHARYAPGSGYALSSSTTSLLMVWLVLCGTGLMGNVANIAHAGGLIVGIVAGMPTFVRFARTYDLKRAFAKGSWEDLNVRGRRRFQRVVIEPYLPLWFLAVALIVVALDIW